MNLAISSSLAIKLTISFKQLTAKVSSFPLNLINYASSDSSVYEFNRGLMYWQHSSLILSTCSNPYLNLSSLYPFFAII